MASESDSKSKRPVADPATSPQSASFADDVNDPHLSPSIHPSLSSSEDPHSHSHSHSDDDDSFSTEEDRARDRDSDPDLSAQSHSPSPPPPPPPPQRAARVLDPSIKPLKSLPMDAITPALPPSKRPKFSSPSAAAAASSPQTPRTKKRLWSTDDELTVLKGLLSYRAKNGGLPASAQEMDAFHHLIRASLTIKVSTIQLSDKVRGLKRKFNQAILQGKQVATPSFPDSHHKTLFNLSNSLWGSNSKNSSTKNKDVLQICDFQDTEIDVNQIQNGHAVAQNGNKNKVSSYPFLSEVVEMIAMEDPNGALLTRAFLAIDKSKASVMEKKINKFRTEEIEQGFKRIDLVKETIKLFLDGLRKSQ